MLIIFDDGNTFRVDESQHNWSVIIEDKGDHISVLDIMTLDNKPKSIDHLPRDGLVKEGEERKQ